MLTDEQLLRYNRQIMMHDFDVAGQERLARASVLIVGLGGLGSAASMYLAAAGVGRLLLADGDTVELSNLQRQIVHQQQSLGSNKAKSAAQSLARLNPELELRVISSDLDEAALPALLQGVDLVVDCTDQYAVRFALNRSCIAAAIPMVSGAAVRSEGQCAVFHPARAGGCYRCLYPQSGAQGALSCSESGVLAPMVGVIGAMQAMEAIKCLAGYGQSLLGQLMVLDLASLEVRRIRLPRRPECPDCSHLPGQD
tara:strand:- start:280829 stop:281590 length:762 start_codon:yes stop_codon:yes gene_type:complete